HSNHLLNSSRIEQNTFLALIHTKCETACPVALAPEGKCLPRWITSFLFSRESALPAGKPLWEVLYQCFWFLPFSLLSAPISPTRLQRICFKVWKGWSGQPKTRIIYFRKRPRPLLLLQYLTHLDRTARGGQDLCKNTLAQGSGVPA